MTLEEILATVATSTVDDWNVITCWAANCGPSFLDRFSVSTGKNWILEHEQHAIRAAYRHDVSLGLAYGLSYMPRHGRKPEELEFDWARRFPDTSVTASWVDMLWNGMLVDRSLVLVVDGGRAVLPAARGIFVPTDVTESELVGETVTAREVAIARLVHSFEHDESEFDRSLERTGFIVVD